MKKEKNNMDLWGQGYDQGREAGKKAARKHQLLYSIIERLNYTTSEIAELVSMGPHYDQDKLLVVQGLLIDVRNRYRKFRDKIKEMEMASTLVHGKLEGDQTGKVVDPEGKIKEN